MSSCYIFIDPNARWLQPAAKLARQGNTVVAVLIDIYDGLLRGWRDVTEDIYIIQDFEEESLIEQIRVVAGRYSKPVVFCETDRYMIAVAKACDRMKIRFPSLDGTISARNKALTREATSKNRGFRFRHAPSLDDLRLAAEDVGYPCIIKPAAGAGSCLAYPIYNKSHVSWYLDEAGRSLSKIAPKQRWFVDSGWLCETLVSGPMVTVFIAADGRDIKAFALARNLRQTLSECVGFGSITPALNGVKADSIFKFAEASCQKLNLRLGVFDVEIIIGSHGLVLVEVNPRPPGGEMLTALSASSDRDIFEYILNIYSGSALASNPPRFTREVLIWKLMAAESGALRLPLACALKQVLPNGLEYIYRSTREEQFVHQLDCLARVIIPTDDAVKMFNAVSNLTPQMSEVLGVQLLSGELPLLPDSYMCSNEITR